MKFAHILLIITKQVIMWSKLFNKSQQYDYIQLEYCYSNFGGKWTFLRIFNFSRIKKRISLYNKVNKPNLRSL